MDNIKIGDTVKIIKMEGEPQYTNREGVVTHTMPVKYMERGEAVLSFLRLINML